MGTKGKKGIARRISAYGKPRGLAAGKIGVAGIFFLAGILTAGAQLVNIETRRMQTDSVRFALAADAWFNYSKQNSDYVYTLSGNLATQFKSPDLRSILFLLGNYNLVSTQDRNYQNAWLVHLRYNRKITDLFRIEAFLQHQRNQLLVIDRRFIVGSGLRLKVISRDHLKAYLGNAALYEIETSTDLDVSNYNWRHSLYFSASLNAWEGKLILTNTLYFQPLYRAIGNHRILEQFKLEVPVTRVLSLSGSYDYFLMSRTPSGSSDRSSNLLFGFTLGI